jgi:hypothetical protein
MQFKNVLAVSSAGVLAAVAIGAGNAASADNPGQGNSYGKGLGNVLHNSKAIDIEPGGSEQVHVLCSEDPEINQDYTATGGGFSSNYTGDVSVTLSRNLVGLNGDYETYNGKGWLVRARNDGSVTRDVRAWVICAYAPQDDPTD